jgi:hypothetical protein
MVEVLFSTSLHALVLSPRLLRILNTKKGATICELTFPSKIIKVQINRKRLVVVLDDSIYLYDISNMKLLHTIDTPPNPHGKISRALPPSSNPNPDLQQPFVHYLHLLTTTCLCTHAQYLQPSPLLGHGDRHTFRLDPLTTWHRTAPATSGFLTRPNWKL